MKPGALVLIGIFLVFAASCASHTKNDAKTTAPSDTPEKAGTLPPLNAKEVYRPDKPEDQKPDETTSRRKSGSKSDDKRITIELPASTLGDVVRMAGTQAGGNIVLMNGVENRIIRDLEIKRRPMDDAVATIAASGGLAIEDSPHYYFLFPPGYEQLLDISLTDRLDARYAAVKTEAVFGSGLPLYSVFMWMGYALRISIVADNSIGDARCGELALGRAPLEHALAAVLKSARVAAVQCDSTPEFIFLSTPANTNPASALIDGASHSDSQKAFLERRITLALPVPLRTGQRMELPLRPSRLGDVLPALAEQLGVRVVAEKGLEQFPVNPFYVRDVTVRTAMDLLVRQWLEPNYGYEMIEDRIVIRTR